MEDIIIHHKGCMYIIDKQPFETYEDAYQRGWFIVNHKHVYTDHKQLISLSFMDNYKKKGMEYA